MSIEIKELNLKVDLLVRTMDQVLQQLSWGNSGAQYEIAVPFRKALDDIERMKFFAVTQYLPHLAPQTQDFSDTIRLKEIEEFLRRRGRRILQAEEIAGLITRPDDTKSNRYVIHLGRFDPQAVYPNRRSWLENPGLKLEFDFDYWRPEGDWQLIENVRLKTVGTDQEEDNLEVAVIPDKLIRRDTWLAILTHAMHGIEYPEVIDELETFFPKETPANLT